MSQHIIYNKRFKEWCDELKKAGISVQIRVEARSGRLGSTADLFVIAFIGKGFQPRHLTAMVQSFGDDGFLIYYPSNNQTVTSDIAELQPDSVKTVSYAEPKASDPESWLACLWDALEHYRGDCLPEGEQRHDHQWDEICTAMAWIRERFDLPGEVDKRNA